MSEVVVTTREERLRAALDEASPVWVLTAPTGFGKTAAMAAMLEGRPGRRELQVPLYELGSSRASVDVDQLAARLRSLGRDLDVVIPDPELAGQRGNSDRGVWDEWAEDAAAVVGSVDGELLLVFDDVQVLTPQAAEVLGTFVGRVANPRHRVMVASRERLRWPLDEWRVGGLVGRLSPDELAYQPHEVDALLPGVDQGPLREATDLFEGWPLPIQLLADRCAGGARGHVATEVVHDVSERLAEALLDGLEPADLRVLCRCSVLQDFPVAVAEEVADEPQAGQILAGLAHHRFLVAMGDGRFHLHPLVRSVLVRRLASVDPISSRDLHHLAAMAWMDQRGHELRALHHLVEAKAWPTAFQLVVDHWSEALTTQRFDLIMATIDACPRRTWANEPTVALFAAATHLVRGDPVSAAVYLGAPAIGDHPAGPIAAKLLVGHASWWATNPETALELTDEVARRLDVLPADIEFPSFPGLESSTAYRIMNDFARARALALVGAFAEARREFLALLDRPGGLRPVPQISALGTMAWVEAMTGQLDDARQFASAAITAADDHGISRDHERLAPANLALALCAYFSYDDAAARVSLDLVARVALANGASGLARTCELVAAECGDVHFVVASPSGPRLRSYLMPMADHIVSTMRARDLVRDGAVAEGAATLAQTPPHELVLFAWVEVRLASSDVEDVRRAIAALPPPETVRGRIERMLVEACLTPDATSAASLARAAIDMAEDRGLRRLLDRAPSHLWIRLGVDGMADPLVVALAARGRRAASGSLDLTAREAEILALLDSPLMVRQIADRLFLSEHTIKWHLARIYRKLGVSGRVGAVERADALGIIGPRDDARWATSTAQLI